MREIRRKLPGFGWPALFGRQSVGNLGSAAVEFAVTAPLLVALVVGSADYAIMANKQATLEAATRAGAEYARAIVRESATATPSGDPNWATTKSLVTGYLTFSPSVTVTTSCTCVDGTATACQGTNSCGSRQPSDPRVLQYVSVSATQNFSPVLAWSAFGFPTQLSATTVARLQ